MLKFTQGLSIHQTEGTRFKGSRDPSTIAKKYHIDWFHSGTNCVWLLLLTLNMVESCSSKEMDFLTQNPSTLPDQFSHHNLCLHPSKSAKQILEVRIFIQSTDNSRVWQGVSGQRVPYLQSSQWHHLTEPTLIHSEVPTPFPSTIRQSLKICIK